MTYDIFRMTEFMGPVLYGSSTPTLPPRAPATKEILPNPTAPKKFIDGLQGVADDGDCLSSVQSEPGIQSSMAGVNEDEYYNDLENEGLAFTIADENVIVAPADAPPTTFVLPGTVNTPSIRSLSLNPTNKAIL